jgi:hypothetical protein
MSVIMGDSMTFGPKNMTEYLAAKRAAASVAASPSLTNDEVLALVTSEYVKLGSSAVEFQYLGDDGSGDPVFKLGTAIVLQNISTQLTALVDAGSIVQIPGANLAYSVNPHLRKT